MHRIGANNSTTFKDILAAFSETSKDRDPHLRLKESDKGDAKVLYAHNKGAVNHPDPEKTLSRRQDASNFVVSRFKAEYAHEPISLQRVLNHIDKDDRFEKRRGDLALKASNVGLMDELMTNELDRTTVLRELGTIYSRNYGPDVVQKAVESVLERDAESGLNVRLNPLNTISLDQKVSADDLRDAFQSAVVFQVARSAAEAVIDPLVHNMFASAPAFKEAACKHWDIILSRGIVDHNKIQTLKPWLAFYPLLDALPRDTSAQTLEKFANRLPLGAHCLLPDKASSLVGIREPPLRAPQGMSIPQWNKLRSYLQLYSAANSLRELLLQSAEQFHLPENHEHEVFLILEEIEKARPDELLDELALVLKSADLPGLSKKQKDDALKTQADDVLLIFGKIEKEKPLNIIDKFDRFKSILDERLTVELNRLNQAQERHKLLGADRSRSKKLRAQELKQSALSKPDEPQDDEKLGRGGEEEGSESDKWGDWNTPESKLRDTTDLDTGFLASPHLRPRRLDFDSDDSSKLKTEERKDAHLAKLDALTPKTEVKTPKGAPSPVRLGLGHYRRGKPPMQIKEQEQQDIVAPAPESDLSSNTEEASHPVLQQEPSPVVSPHPPQQLREAISPAPDPKPKRESKNMERRSAYKTSKSAKTTKIVNIANIAKTVKTPHPKSPDEPLWTPSRPENPPVRIRQLNPLESILRKSTDDQTIAWAQNERDKIVKLKEYSRLDND